MQTPGDDRGEHDTARGENDTHQADFTPGPAGPGDARTDESGVRITSGDASTDPADSLGDEALTRKDMSYSPASEHDVEHRQAHPQSSAATDDPEVDEDAVELLPGTGGPDDVGEIDVEGEPINMPRRMEAR